MPAGSVRDLSLGPHPTARRGKRQPAAFGRRQRTAMFTWELRLWFMSQEMGRIRVMLTSPLGSQVRSGTSHEPVRMWHRELPKLGT